jgi:uncharacterized protein (TIGR03437 family)
LFSTYFGGTGDELPTGLATDSAGDLFLSGTTASPNFPDSLTQFPSGPGFLAELNAGAKKIVSSMRFPAGAAAQDVKLFPLNEVIAAGSSGYLMRLFWGGPLPPTLGVGNAANGGVDNALAPGELVSIYRSWIGPTTPVTAQPDSGKYPDSLAGFQVLFNDTPAPLIYVSPTQINAVDSANLYASPVATIKVVNNGVTVAQITLPQAADRPGIFRNGAGAAAVNEDGAINSASNPAKSGSIVSIWATGASGLSEASGYVATLSNVANYYSPNGLLQLLNNATAFSPPNGLYQVSYAGPAPDIIGAIFQINLQLPPAPAVPDNGLLPVFLLAGGVLSPRVSIYVVP